MPTDIAELMITALSVDFPRPVLLRTLRTLRDEVVARQPEPDVWIGGKENPYMKRWWLLPRRKYPFNLYLHQFLRSDDDRALHDHPWANISILIEGSYIEHVPTRPSWPATGSTALRRYEGDIVYRPSAEMCHRVELLPYRGSLTEVVKVGDLKPVWTIFATGPKVRDWGFHCPQGWKPWQEFTGQDESHGPVTDARVLGGGCGES